MTKANRQHGMWLKNSHAYHQSDNILKRLILPAILNTCTNTVKDDDTGCGSVTTLAILTRLCDTYGEISDMEIEDNLTPVSTLWWSSIPIDNRFRKLNIAQKFLIKAKDPISDKVYICISLNLIKEVGILVDTCREWSLLPSISRTKARFHLIFSKDFRYHTETEKEKEMETM